MAPAAPRTSRAGHSDRPAPSVYVLLGEEDVRAEEVLRSLLDALLPAEQRSLNLDVLDAAEVPIRDVITRCETLPFFGPRRVVVVRRAGELRAPDQDALAGYLERGAPPSVVVLVADKLDRRRRLYGVVQRTGRVVPCGRLDPGDLPAWVGARARREGKTIAPDAARLLAALAGGGLRLLALEIAKLAAYAGERGEITAEDVRAAASHAAAATVFELMDAVGRREPDRALRLLQTVLTGGAPPAYVLYMLEDQVRMLLRTRAVLERSATRAQAKARARETFGPRAWLFDRYCEQAAAFRGTDAAGMLRPLLDTDEAIKTGAAPPRLALETLVVRLCLGEDGVRAER